MMLMHHPTSGMVLKACWNTLGSVMKMSEGPLSGLMPTEKAAGKIMSPAKMAIMVSSVTI